MKSSSLNLVPLKRSLLTFTSKHQLSENIVQQVSSIGDLNSLKRDLEFLLYICRLVETESSEYKGKDKLDKKEVVKNIVVRLFPELNNNQDLDFIDRSIEFLHSNKRIKGISRLAKVAGYVGDYFVRKFLWLSYNFSKNLILNEIGAPNLFVQTTVVVTLKALGINSPKIALLILMFI